MSQDTLSQKLDALNRVDLSGLQKKLAEIRKKAEEDLKKNDKKATKTDIENAAKQAGITVDEFMAALERAKKMGLI